MKGESREGPQNLDQTPNFAQTLQEVVPCGQEERRPGGFQVRGMRIGIIDDGPWTDDMHDSGETSDRQRCRIRWARTSTPLPHQEFLIIPILLLWGAL